ncbi:MAG: 2,3-bisphosphoglycerate-independent phosphoglycerate mutase, partial [Patescibacteria group bacterium]|nr:2,3-bisphosphoglycerate-independent phosphoglycerate mutase [Patescibacteria group bacterium]
VSELERHLGLLGVGSVSSVSGRYYAMDRDRRWQRTEKVYKALTEGVGHVAHSAKDAIEMAYQKGQTDEFIEPTLIVPDGKLPGVIKDNDAVIFANFRIDRAKQLTMAFVLPDFETLKAFDFGYDPQTNLKVGTVEFGSTFVRKIKPKNLVFVTMTEYQKDLPVTAVAFGPEQVEMSFGEVISKAGMSQLRMSESEKERFVTYYFNGLREAPFPGEDKLIVPSPKVPTYDQKPEMSLYELVDKCKRQISNGKYNFILINFANPDMLGHTGNIKATIKALEAVDRNLKEIVSYVLKYDGLIAITADHGNCEEMLRYPSSTFFYTSQKGVLNTDHSNNPVPFLLIGKRYQGWLQILRTGSLSDVAPTLLGLMGLNIPSQMTGQSLLLEAVKT